MPCTVAPLKMMSGTRSSVTGSAGRPRKPARPPPRRRLKAEPVGGGGPAGLPPPHRHKADRPAADHGHALAGDFPGEHGVDGVAERVEQGGEVAGGGGGDTGAEWGGGGGGPGG